MRFRRGLRASAALVTTTASAGAFLILGATTAGADSSYTATGQADGFSIRITNQAIPLLTAVTLSGPTAQATLDSLDQSNAFASFPYPGDEEVGIIGLLGSVFGIPVPQYPAYASTSYGQPPANQDLPGINLQAQSTHDVSSAEATVGESGAIKADSAVRNEAKGDGSVTSTASAIVNAFSFGNVLSISGLHNTASAARTSTGKLTRSSDLSIARISVPGLALPIPKALNLCPVNQIPIGGIPAFPCPPPFNAIPLPAGVGGSTLIAPDIGFENGFFTLSLPQLGTQKFAIPSDMVLSSLKAAGILATFQKPVKTKSGIISGSLVMEAKLPGSPIPIPNNPVLGAPGPTDSVITLGGASAAVDLTAFGTGVVSVPAIGTSDGTVPIQPVSTPVTSTGSGDLPSVGPGSAPGASAVPGGTSPQIAPSEAGIITAGHQLRNARNSAGLYLALVASAILAFGATQIIRIIGVRKLWAS